MKMKWNREYNGTLALYLSEGEKWIRYNNHNLYEPDEVISSNNGFKTAQKALKLGYSYIKLEENNESQWIFS